MTAIVAVGGPTASGKTTLGIEVAKALGTEIISADSMQVYRGMEIGTAAPTLEECARVKHHFVTFLDPDTPFSAGAFQKMARPIVDRLNAQGKPAVAVGGSGLYLSALVDGLFDGPSRNEELRQRLKREAEATGVDALYDRLRESDPDYAAVIHAGDLRRIVRALEVYELTGRPLSQWHAEDRALSEPYDALFVAIDWPREELYERIDQRAHNMLNAGLLDEVRALLDKGYGPQLERLRTLGYREMAAYLRREVSLDEAIETMQRNTRRFAKRQLSWFRNDPRFRWLDAHAGEPHVLTVLRWLEETGPGRP